MRCGPAARGDRHAGDLRHRTRSRVFELDFEENLASCAVREVQEARHLPVHLRGVRHVPRQGVRRGDLEPRLGPINKQRWIYSCSKQLLDRVIYAYGSRRGSSSRSSAPSTGSGPKLDNVGPPKEGSSRVLTQFLHNILHGEQIQLVDGGAQRRSLHLHRRRHRRLMRIIENKDGCADGRIFNIGNPANDLSIRELAERLVKAVGKYPAFAGRGEEDEDRHRHQPEVLRQGLPGHPDARAVDQAREEEARLDAEGGFRRGDQAHARLLPEGTPAPARAVSAPERAASRSRWIATRISARATDCRTS